MSDHVYHRPVVIQAVSHCTSSLSTLSECSLMHVIIFHVTAVYSCSTNSSTNSACSARCASPEFWPLTVRFAPKTCRWFYRTRPRMSSRLDLGHGSCLQVKDIVILVYLLLALEFNLWLPNTWNFLKIFSSYLSWSVLETKSKVISNSLTVITLNFVPQLPWWSLALVLVTM